MAKPRISSGDLVDRASVIFRSAGYEGTSFSLLAEAAGIEKASIYYHFPGGKEQIVEAAAMQIYAWLEKHVCAPLYDMQVPLRRRVRAMVKQLGVFYADGKIPCALDTLSLPGGSVALQTALRTALQAWLDAFTVVAAESGFSRNEAARRAEQALVQIEGSLVLARVLGSPRPFRQALAGLTGTLTGSSD